MKQRIITAVVMALILLPLLLIEKLFIGFQIVLLLFVIIGAYELIKMFEREKPIAKIIKVLIIVLSIVTYLAALLSFGVESIANLYLINIKIGFLPSLMISTVVLFGAMVFVESFDGRDVGKALIIINYIGLGCAAITSLRYMGLRFILYLFIVTVSTDIFAYHFGMKFGKHKMAPKISPKKSWEGAIGGTIAGTILGTCFAFFYGSIFKDLNFPTLLHFCSLGNNNEALQFVIIFFITFFLSIMGQIGDLVASRLKRTYDIKDFGNIFPGHGGVLDRFDSAIYGSLFLLAIFMILKDLFPLV